MNLARKLAVGIFLLYLAVFPGSAVVVAADRVPDWGGWMGGALLLAQGAAALFWLVGFYGRRGALAALAVLLLAWGVEHLGVSSGFPFGRYTYTTMLQPQLFGVVPLPIACAWLMVAAGGWQIAGAVARTASGRITLAATLVLLLDLQIETVATRVNSYWIWHDSGWYYGVPTANFVAWWLVGLLMAFAVARILPPAEAAPLRPGRRMPPSAVGIPAALYMLSTLMFTVVNLARGYPLAGLIGLGVLLGAALWLLPLRIGVPLPARDARKAE